MLETLENFDSPNEDVEVSQPKGYASTMNNDKTYT